MWYTLAMAKQTTSPPVDLDFLLRAVMARLADLDFRLDSIVELNVLSQFVNGLRAAGVEDAALIICYAKIDRPGNARPLLDSSVAIRANGRMVGVGGEVSEKDMQALALGRLHSQSRRPGADEPTYKMKIDPNPVIEFVGGPFVGGRVAGLIAQAIAEGEAHTMQTSGGGTDPGRKAERRL